MRSGCRKVAAALAVAAAVCCRPTDALAQRRGHPRHSVVFVGGYFYDPWFGPYPWWPAYAYPYPYRPIYQDNRAQLRIEVTPKEAGVYVDGFYAGIVDDFDGFFQALPVPPGGHELVLYLPGYRTVHQRLDLSPGATYRISYAMQPLPAGQTSEPPPSAPSVPPPPPGSAELPRGMGPPPGAPPARQPTAPELPPAPEAAVPHAPSFGALAIRVQPSDAEILIDGENWNGSTGTGRLVVQIGEGRHRLEIRRPGYRSFAMDVEVHAGETTPINVSLSPEKNR
jgi:hypothetical protein